VWGRSGGDVEARPKRCIADPISPNFMAPPEKRPLEVERSAA